MNENISCKDLDYLADMFNWNYNGYRIFKAFNNNVDDMQVRDIFNKSLSIFQDALNDVVNILGGHYE